MTRPARPFITTALLVAAALLALAGCEDKATDDKSGGAQEPVSNERNPGKKAAAQRAAAEEAAADKTAAQEAAARESTEPCKDYFEAVSEACRQSLREGLEFNCGLALVELQTIEGLGDGKFAKGQESTCRSYLEKVNEVLATGDGQARVLPPRCVALVGALDRCLGPIAEGEVPEGCEMPIKTLSTMASRGPLEESTCEMVLGMMAPPAQ